MESVSKTSTHRNEYVNRDMRHFFSDVIIYPRVISTAAQIGLIIHSAWFFYS